MATTLTRNRMLRRVSAAVVAAVLMHRGADAAELSACVDQSSPAAAMDAKVIKAVARQLVMTPRIENFDGSSDDDDGLSPKEFRKLLAGRCDLVMGFPVDAHGGSVPDGLLASAPYAATGFVLVTRDRAVARLDALPEHSTVGVTYMTAPNLYFSAHPRVSPHVYMSDAGSVNALEKGDVQAAMLWRPFVASQLSAPAGKRLRYSALDEPHASWNLVALYKPEARELAAQFAKGVAQLRVSGELQKLVQPYADAAPATPVAPAAQAPVSLHRATLPHGRLHLVAVSAKPQHDDAPPGLFTLAQADTGKTLFRANCAICHGPKLEGRAGPPLRGPTFANPEAGFHVGDIFKIVAENMPAPAPGSLPHDDYVNIMAYILQQNGYPAGSTALTFDGAMQSKVKLVYREQPSS